MLARWALRQSPPAEEDQILAHALRLYPHMTERRLRAVASMAAATDRRQT